MNIFDSVSDHYLNQQNDFSETLYTQPLWSSSTSDNSNDSDSPPSPISPSSPLTPIHDGSVLPPVVDSVIPTPTQSVPNVPPAPTNLLPSQLMGPMLFPSNPIMKNMLQAQNSAPAPMVQFPVLQLQELIKNQQDKRKKLKRKAELARLSRRKKKVRMCDLEHQVSDLTTELEKLRKENARLRQAAKRQSSSSSGGKGESAKECSGSDSSPAGTPEGPSIQVVLDKILAEKTPSNQLHSEAHELLRARADSTRRNMEELEEGLATVMPLQVLQWLLCQRSPFYQDQHGLFLSLFRDELKATPQQLKTIQKWRKPKPESRVSDSAIQEAFQRLSELVKAQGTTSQAEQFEAFSKLLTPTQFVAYLKWVKTFGHICVKINT